MHVHAQEPPLTEDLGRGAGARGARGRLGVSPLPVFARAPATPSHAHTGPFDRRREMVSEWLAGAVRGRAAVQPLLGDSPALTDSWACPVLDLLTEGRIAEAAGAATSANSPRLAMLLSQMPGAATRGVCVCVCVCMCVRL